MPRPYLRRLASRRFKMITWRSEICLGRVLEQIANMKQRMANSAKLYSLSFKDCFLRYIFLEKNLVIKFKILWELKKNGYVLRN